jgi:hypothetical protein
MRLGRKPRSLILSLVACLAVAGLAAPVAVWSPSSSAPASPGQRVSSARIVSFGLYGPESVFESEARRAAAVLREWLGSDAQPLVAFNGKRRASATVDTLAASLRAAVGAMDVANEVLVVVLTSHGSPEGLAIVAGRREDTLTPTDLREVLDGSGAKYRAVIISACYSGVFIPALADARTLVITAAAADRPSFGCEDGATWTYFGDAFFNQALRTARDLSAAFAEGRRLVTARELKEGFEPSNPQMAGGTEVLPLLVRH